MGCARPRDFRLQMFKPLRGFVSTGRGRSADDLVATMERESNYEN